MDGVGVAAATGERGGGWGVEATAGRVTALMCRVDVVLTRGVAAALMCGVVAASTCRAVASCSRGDVGDRVNGMRSLAAGERRGWPACEPGAAAGPLLSCTGSN